MQRIEEMQQNPDINESRVMLIVCFLVLTLSGCTKSFVSDHSVKDASTAIRIGLNVCVSKIVVQPSRSVTHAELRNGSWHVWEQGRRCEVFSTDVNAKSRLTGPCSVCMP
jgi:hypothetical protein